MVVLGKEGYTSNKGNLNPWSSSEFLTYGGKQEPGRMTNLTIYQAKAGDGVKLKGLKRVDSYFKTPEEAASEALSLKARLDKLYENNIQWDYEANMSGKSGKVKILRGYLNGNRKTNPFYLEISSTKKLKNSVTSTPIKPKNMSEEDQKVVTSVIKLFNDKKK